jgi:hypothetical protein
MAWRTRWALGFGLALLGGACGDDSSGSETKLAEPEPTADSEPNAEADPEDATADGGADANDGTTAGNADAAVPAIEVNLTDEGGMECGGTFCQGAELPAENITVSACCPDEDGSACGLNLTILGILLGLKNPGCEALDLPGSQDDICEESPPKTALGINDSMPFQMPGCCLPSGKCGYDATFFDGFGFGCVSPERFGDDEGPDCSYAGPEK